MRQARSSLHVIPLHTVTPASALKASARMLFNRQFAFVSSSLTTQKIPQKNLLRATPPKTYLRASNMAPKRSQARDSTPSASTRSHSGTSTPSRNAPGGTSSSSAIHGTTSSSSTTATTVETVTSTSKSFSKSGGGAAYQSPQDVAMGIWNQYLDTTPQRTKLIDVFMAFLVIVGVLQFVYCVLVGNYPFNAFLSGFSATVGQFVLTASLRIQTNPQNKADFNQISPERAFADYVFGSLILHFFCVNFIN